MERLLLAPTILRYRPRPAAGAGNMAAMGTFTEPVLPDVDLDEWAARPYFERLRAMCVDWTVHGFGIPPVAYVFYAVKLVVYVGAFVFVASLTPGIGGVTDVGEWWFEPIVFQKAVIWTLLWEVLGLGCGSGPLTGRMNPPFTAVSFFTRPGTVRQRPFAWVPFTAGDTRTIVDVALYVALLGFGIRALFSSPVDADVIVPIVVVALLAGLRDKTVFLAARAEHYLLTTAVFLSTVDGLAGAKAVQLALWFGAASSKLNRHFPSVMTVMLSNHPVNKSKRFQKALYRNHPDDLRSSKLAAAIAHGATVIEYGFPLVLAFATNNTLITVAVVVMVCFHLGILSSFPLGVPLEWNLFFVFSTLSLWGHHRDVRFWHIDSPWLIAVLVVCAVVIPVVGNLWPAKVSFLPSMRYYAGNWAGSVWLFKPGVYEKVCASVVSPIPTYLEQVDEFVGADLAAVTLARGQAFRSMHLQGRALNALVARAVRDDEGGLAVLDPVMGSDEAMVVLDGELVAATILGWNFGDGHLHNEQLLASVTARADLAPGDLRCVFLESQPVRRPLHWRIADAATGQIAEGHIRAADLEVRQPWTHDVPLHEVGALAPSPVTN